MSIVVTNIGSSTTVATGAITITVGVGGVPAGAAIFVAASDSGTSAGTVSDSKSNLYLTERTSTNGSNLTVSLYRCSFVIALVNGDTIKYTLNGTLGAVSVFYATGLANVGQDTAVGAGGTSATPSVTSPVPSSAGDLFIGVVGGATLISSFTQDSTNAAWASPPGSVSNAAPVLGGGNVVNPSATALTYAPTFGTSDNWRAVIAAFFPAPPLGWEANVPQPPHQRPEQRAAAVARGDDGAYATQINFQPMGFEIQPPQPPHPRSERSGAVARGDDGVYDILRQWFPVGNQQESGWQPPHRAPEIKAGALKSRSQFGIFPNLKPMGWEVQPIQPPHPRPERAAAIMVGDTGTEAAFVPPSTTPWGYEFQPMTSRWNPKWTAFVPHDDGVYDVLRQWFVTGWEVQPVQPGHPRTERAASIQVGDSGIQAPFVFVAQAVVNGWDFVTSPITYHKRPENAGAVAVGDSGTQAPFLVWRNGGWEIASFQPPHPRPERSGAVQVGESGTEATFTPPPVYVSGWDFLTTTTVLHPRPERAGAMMVGELGIENTYTFVAPPVIQWGYEPSPQPPHPRWERGAVARGKSEFGIFPNLVPVGWEVQAVQPPHPRPEKGAQLPFGHQGTDAVFVPPVIVPVTWGFEVPWLPRAFGIARGPAIEGRSDFASPLPLINGWDAIFPQPPHTRFERSGAIAASDSGTQAPYIFVPPTIYVSGWDFLTTTTILHPRPERAGAILLGDQGIQAQFVPPALPTWGWEAQLAQLIHPLTERRAGAIMRGDEGIELPFAVWYSFGWPIQSVQPPHPAPERWSAAIMRGDDGIQFIYVKVFATFPGAGGLTVSASFIQHMCLIPGPGPATLPSVPGPGPKVC